MIILVYLWLNNRLESASDHLEMIHSEHLKGLYKFLLIIDEWLHAVT